MATIQIKPIENGDSHIWLPLWRDYQRFYGAEILEPVTVQAWARLLDPVEPMYAALAIVDEQALGLVHSICHRTTWSKGVYWTTHESNHNAMRLYDKIGDRSEFVQYVKLIF